MYPNALHQSVTLGTCDLELASINVRFAMLLRNRSYTSERRKLKDHSNNALQRHKILLLVRKFLIYNCAC
jgi:hypothetical protein